MSIILRNTAHMNVHMECVISNKGVRKREQTRQEIRSKHKKVTRCELIIEAMSLSTDEAEKEAKELESY